MSEREALVDAAAALFLVCILNVLHEHALWDDKYVYPLLKGLDKLNREHRGMMNESSGEDF